MCETMIDTSVNKTELKMLTLIILTVYPVTSRHVSKILDEINLFSRFSVIILVDVVSYLLLGRCPGS